MEKRILIHSVECDSCKKTLRSEIDEGARVVFPKGWAFLVFPDGRDSRIYNETKHVCEDCVSKVLPCDSVPAMSGCVIPKPPLF